MIQSMTGYGNTTSGKGSNRFTISIKTVNARFLDIKFKGCDLEPNVEKEIRDIISAKLVRGTVFINFDQNLTSNDEASHFNEERFEMLLSVIDRIDKKYKRIFDPRALRNCCDKPPLAPLRILGLVSTRN